VIHWLRLRGKQFCYLALSRVYGFDAWHYRVVRENCGYFSKVRAVHDGLDPAVSIEIGCGLGEVIAGLNARVRIGVDRDPAVIKAAQWLHKRDARFVALSHCPGNEMYAGERGRVCLLFLNWFHAVTPADVRDNVRTHVERFRPTHLVFDVINEGVSNYQYKHDPQFLREFGSVASVIDAGDCIRRLVVVEVGTR
jgi:hypothetical protein